MSGTSLDGIDCALVRIGNAPPIELIHTLYFPFDKDLRSQLQTAINKKISDKSALQDLHLHLGILYSQAVTQILDEAHIRADEIEAIGCHGQTILHQPNIFPPMTLQIGDAQELQKRTGIQTINDFRSLDVQLGGQGAPLAPLFHEWYFKSQAPCVIINIGGIANITYIPKDSVMSGFDTGPGNTLLDQYFVTHHSKNSTHAYDMNGNWAKTGTVNQDLLLFLLKDPFFGTPAPKSTGTDHFNLGWLSSKLQQFQEKHFQELYPNDIQATLTALTAKSIANAINSQTAFGAVFLCGGGTHNTFLTSLIQNYLGNKFKVSPTDLLGVPADWLEAICFAWLAKQRIEEIKFHLNHITGNPTPIMLGNLN